jgi:hypothetical protein
MTRELSAWVAIATLAAMLLGAGIWLGKLEQKVDDNLIYYHGTTQVPSPKGQ